LSGFNENLIFSADFRKIFKHQISLNSLQYKPNCSIWTHGQTDIPDEANSRFLQFCEKRPKMND